MAEEFISESERLQIEQLRELETEELEIEEVDDDGSSSDENPPHVGVSASGIYDTSLVPLHSYLGDVDNTHHRLAFLDGGAIITLPLFYLEGVVLFPEATLPLRVIFPNFITCVERAMRQTDAPYTIGVVHIYRDSDNGRIRFSTIGTTAEIRQYRRLEDGSVNIVARGQQRFCLRRRLIDAEGAPCGEVQIIIEDLPMRTPREAVGKLAPLRNSQIGDVWNSQPHNGCQLNRASFEGKNDFEAMSGGSFENELSLEERRLHQSALVSCFDLTVSDESTSSDDDIYEQDSEFPPERSQFDVFMESTSPAYGRQKFDMIPQAEKRALIDVQRFNQTGMENYMKRPVRDIPGAFWPSWVYYLFDSYSLSRKAVDRWKWVVKVPSMDGLVMKPDLLSFRIASKIPVSESKRQELLEIDGTSYRLRREIELLETFDQIRCITCQILIARRSDILVMSSDGPLGAYANPHGFVHEVMTLIEANGIGIAGPPVKEFSWFPGYAWSVAECTTCGTQLGWHFSSINKKMRPLTFWGIRISQILDDTH